jgi:hypothetical protein
MSTCGDLINSAEKGGVPKETWCFLHDLQLKQQSPSSQRKTKP